jgi:hypothetical protein
MVLLSAHLLIFELVEGLRHQRKMEPMAFNYFCFAIRPTTATSLPVQNMFADTKGVLQ